MIDRQPRRLQFDLSQWNFGFDDLLEPVAKRVAETILQVLGEENGAFDSIWIERDIGPALAITDGDVDHVIFPLSEATLYGRGNDGEDGHEGEEIEASIRGTEIGIELFERWAAELRKDLDKLKAFQREQAEWPYKS